MEMTEEEMASMSTKLLVRQFRDSKRLANVGPLVLGDSDDEKIEEEKEVKPAGGANGDEDGEGGSAAREVGRRKTETKGITYGEEVTGSSVQRL